jgi:rare lipoprotein A
MLFWKRRPSLAVCLIAVEMLALGVAAVLPLGSKAPETACAPTMASVQDKPQRAQPVSTDGLSGVASWYGEHWQGRETASGARFNWRQLTAAHRTLPLNTPVRVTNQQNGRSVIVLITDRGPYIDGRVIDLSLAAAKHLGMVKQGLAPVCIELVERAQDPIG